MRTGLTTAGYALIEGRFEVMGGSMGAAHGERVVPAYRRACDTRVAPRETAWHEVLAARHPERPSGDRWAAAVIVTMNRNRPRPEGFRLARRAANLASRIGMPLVTFVDTPGADPSPSSEAAGIAGEIARTFATFDAVTGPTVAICVGEGGSGGALALAHTERLLMLEHSIFSVIAPEGAAAILDRTTGTAPERAADLKLTAADLLSLGIVDEVIREDGRAVRKALLRAIDDAVPGDRRRRADTATGRWLV